jgi:3-hydroxyacyl-CoA dehydrogenase
VVGLHFFSPANVMKLLEVVRGKKTAKDVMATVMAVAKKIKKTAVVSGVCDGFIGNRMIEQYGRQGGFLLDEGCTPAQVDKAMEKFGMAMGPFRMGDLAGNDIGWAIRKRRYQEKPDMKYSKTADLLCEKGRFGQKTGAGWYDYVAGKRDAIPTPKWSDDRGAPQGAGHHAAQDFGRRNRAAPGVRLVNEAAHILEEGIANKASDIDIVYIFGYGFPAHRGGPMNYADQVGLFNVVQAMNRFARTRWTTPSSGSPHRCWPVWPPKARPSTEPHRPFKHPARIRNHHDIRRNRFYRPYAPGQELEGRLQHDPRRHPGWPRRAARHQARRHRCRRGGRRHHGLRQPRRRHRCQHRTPDRAARRPARSPCRA